MIDLRQKRVLVTGGAGFLGSFVAERLRTRGCRELFVVRSREYDLRDIRAVERLYKEKRPEVVLHLAAVVGGIGINQREPGRFFYENAIMGLQMMEQARLHGVEKFVSAGTICAYPKHAPIPFNEGDLWNGYPEETNAPYGLAKKMLLVQGQSYHQQYGFNSLYLLPVNLYGPRDNFDPDTSHVIPALIRKCLEATDEGRDEIVLWGDGSATREFLYVDEAAEGILLAAERFEAPDPVNLGSGEEIAIRDLAALVATLTNFRGRVKWDTARPNGQPRRCLDVSRARKQFGFSAKVPLREGLEKTIAWYRAHRKQAEVAIPLKKAG